MVLVLVLICIRFPLSIDGIAHIGIAILTAFGFSLVSVLYSVDLQKYCSSLASPFNFDKIGKLANYVYCLFW